MAFGKRSPSSAPSSPLRAAASARRAEVAFLQGGAPNREREQLLDELRVMARATGSKSEPKFHGSVSGRLVKESGPDADPVLVNREGVADGCAVRRSDYWSSNILGNASAIIGVAGGVALGFGPHGVIGFMFIFWGLTAVASGRMMQSNRWSSRVFMGKAARLAGLGMMLTGAWFIFYWRAEPAIIGLFNPHYHAPENGLLAWLRQIK